MLFRSKVEIIGENPWRNDGDVVAGTDKGKMVVFALFGPAVNLSRTKGYHTLSKGNAPWSLLGKTKSQPSEVPGFFQPPAARLQPN